MNVIARAQLKHMRYAARDRIQSLQFLNAPFQVGALLPEVLH